MVPTLALMLVLLTIEIWRYSPSYRPSCLSLFFKNAYVFYENAYTF
jgi:hypothetical protein